LDEKIIICNLFSNSFEDIKFLIVDISTFGEFFNGLFRTQNPV